MAFDPTALKKKLSESTGKAGVYYVVRFPTRWRLYSFPWEVFGDLRHGDDWRRYAAPDLAEAGSPKLAISVKELEEQLKPLAKGFPRGRVKRLAEKEYTIFHGDDFGLYPEINREVIERTFELGNC